jgi:hypothetical protein
MQEKGCLNKVKEYFLLHYIRIRQLIISDKFLKNLSQLLNKCRKLQI